MGRVGCRPAPTESTDSLQAVPVCAVTMEVQTTITGLLTKKKSKHVDYEARSKGRPVCVEIYLLKLDGVITQKRVGIVFCTKCINPLAGVKGQTSKPRIILNNN